MSQPAAAAPKRITGKLSKPGYTVIAVAADGRASLVRAARGTFRLRPRAASVTLHLRGPDGVYAGPIVIARKRGRAIVGVRAGARLGTVRVRRGYARVARRLPRTSLDARRTARARRGVPIGAGNFGRVRSRPPRDPVPGDRDLDGVPNPLDIDDDGDLILDNFDRSIPRRGARAAQEGGCGPSSIYCPSFYSALALSLETTVNANARDPSGAPAFTDEELNAPLASFGFLQFAVPPGDSVELDCAGDPLATPPRPVFSYCSTGGTGRGAASGPGPPFPGEPFDSSSFDPDGDGFGRLDPSLEPLACPACPRSDFFLTHGATTAEIKTGQVLFEWVANGIPESQCPPQSASCAPTTPALQYVFATVLALISYSDTKAPTPNSATVTYPTPPPTGDCGPPCNAPGTQGNGFPVAPGPDGQIVLTLTFWRPQRRPTSDAECVQPPQPMCTEKEWVDAGHLTYGAFVDGACPDDAFIPADPPDQNLTLTPSTPRPLGPGWGFTDDKADEVSSPGNTLTYKLNLSRCLEANAVSFASGEERMVVFKAAPGNPDYTQQTVSFKRQ